MGVKVSSITYVRNGERFIERCIRSIMNQSLKDIEIIVVDGNSTDKTFSILEELSREDDRILLLQKGGSVGGQFNAAMDVASGEYIAVCEGDDCIVEDKYEKLYEYAHNNKLDVIRACYSLWFEYCKGDYFYKVEIIPENKSYNTVMNLTEDKYVFLSTFVNGFWNGLYNREFLQKHDIKMNETKGAAFQDITFSFLTQLYAERISFMSDVYHYYRIDNPESSVNSKNCIAMLMTEYSLLRDELIRRNLWKEYKNIFFFWEFISFKQFMDRNLEDDKLQLVKEIYKYIDEQKEFEVTKEIKVFHTLQQLFDGYMNGIDEYCRVMTDDDEKHKKVLEFFNEKIKEESHVIIFGAGHFGRVIGDYLGLIDKSYSFIDNSKALQESGVGTHKVMPVTRENIDDKSYIAVANIRFADEMKEELVAMGISDDRIIICDYEDFFIREIYMKYKINYLAEG